MDSVHTDHLFRYEWVVNTCKEQYLRISQRCPENPAPHEHVKTEPLDEHIPLFWHGWGVHGSEPRSIRRSHHVQHTDGREKFRDSRISQWMPSKAAGHVHVKPPALFAWQVAPCSQMFGKQGLGGMSVVAAISRSVFMLDLSVYSGSYWSEELTDIATATSIPRWTVTSERSSWLIKDTWTSILTWIWYASIT